VRTGQLVERVLALLGLRADLFAPSVQPGEMVGPLLAEVAASVEIRSAVSVVAVASHDTASAVLASPALVDDFAYVVCGTWSLVGLKLDRAVIAEDSRQANFSNELGADGTVRFLRNVMGHWMLQECERTWALSGHPGHIGDAGAGVEVVPDQAVPTLPFPAPSGASRRAAAKRAGRPALNPLQADLVGPERVSYFRAAGGVVAAVRSQPQLVLMAKLYRPAAVNGLWPPPPRPVCTVKLNRALPCLAELSTKVPRALGRFWQSNLHVTVHFDGRATEAKALSPVPERRR